MDKEILMKNLWEKYIETKDYEYLAKACENAPFFNNPEIGKELAIILREIKN